MGGNPGQAGHHAGRLRPVRPGGGGMSVAFTRWPDDLAARYRAAGYWNDQPMTEMLARQCRERPDAPAVLCGEREISYAEL
ncbi:hypothetical protein ABH310_11935, partial [Chromobacterium piscinae]